MAKYVIKETMNDDGETYWYACDSADIPVMPSIISYKSIEDCERQLYNRLTSGSKVVKELEI